MSARLKNEVQPYLHETNSSLLKIELFEPDLLLKKIIKKKLSNEHLQFLKECITFFFKLT